MASKIVLDGYTLPQGVMVQSDVKDFQKALGVKIDGIWGPKTQAAYDKYTYERGPTASLAYPGLSLPLGVDTAAGVRAVQKQLGKYQTGLWDYASQNEYDKFIVQNMPKDFDFDFSRYTITPQRAYELDKIGYEWGIGRSDDGDHVMSGYTTPEGADDHDGVKRWQQVLGVTQDGIWGPRTQKAYDRLLEMGVQAMQTNTQTSGTNTQQSNGQAPWQNMVTTTEKQGGSTPSTAVGSSTDQGQISKLSTQQSEGGNSKTYEQKLAIRQLQQERDRQINRIEALPAWQKTHALGAGPSAAYADAMERIDQINEQIAQINNTIMFESTPKATPSPTQTPSPTPDPTPQPGYITDIKITEMPKNTPKPVAGETLPPWFTAAPTSFDGDYSKLDPELLLLITMVATEAADKNELEWRACAFVALNRRGKHGWEGQSLTQILNEDNFRGLQNEKNRKASDNYMLGGWETSRDKKRDRIANEVIAAYRGLVDDPTNGATYFSGGPARYTGEEVIIAFENGERATHHRFFRHPNDS